MDSPYPGSTEYTIQSAYYNQDVQSYSQFVTMANGSSSINVNVVTPTGTEYLSTILTNAGQLYSISSVNNFTSIEFYNNTDESICYVDMAGLLTDAVSLSTSGLIIRPLTYYYFSKPIVSNQIKIESDTAGADVRIIGHFA
jgi:hypothetical protein